MSSAGLVIRRSRQAQQYVTIPNKLAQNGGLSLRARGLLVMLLSFPPEWRTTTADIARGCPEGRDAVRSAMRELRDAGYVVLVTERGEGGRFARHLEVFDTPQEALTEDAVSPPGATPAESAPPQDSRGSAGPSSPAQTYVSAGHAGDGKPGPGSPTVGGPGDITKTVNKDVKDGPADLASRRGRAKRATAKPTVQSVVADVTRAAVIVYGLADTRELTDGHALALYFTYAHRKDVHDLVAYMMKIFGDAPHLDTFIANAGWCCPSCQRWEDGCRCAAA